MMQSKGSTVYSSVYSSTLKKISRGILYAGTLLLPLFYLPYTLDVLNLPKQYLLYTVVLLGLLLWLMKVAVTKELLLRRTLLDIPFIGIAILALLSGIMSQSASLSFLGNPEVFVLHVGFIFALIFWTWLVIQEFGSRKSIQYLISTFLLSGTIVGIIFIFRNSLLFSGITSVAGDNLVSKFNSIFGIYMAGMATFALGYLQIKGRSVKESILPCIATVVSIIVLLMISFTVAWVVLLIGLALLLVLGITMMAETKFPVLITSLVLFIATMLLVFVGTPQFLKATLPVEVALGSSPSWDITQNTFFGGVKPFLFGSGPGTFVYDFSMHRTPAFNLSQIAWSTRFQQPYNSLFALMAEFGILGTLTFVLLILMVVGGIFTTWLKTRPSVWKRAKSAEEAGDGGSMQLRYEAFIPAVAWIALTVGMMIAFYDVLTWWAWFFYLAITLVSIAFIVPDIIKEKKIDLKVSPQYAPAMSFGVVLMVAVIIVFGAIGIRYYLGEITYKRATLTASFDKMEGYLKESINYRKNHPRYHTALARVYLQQAKQKVEQESASPESIAPLLAEAVNEAKIATDKQPNNVQTWDVLSFMYLNARAFAPEANTWAKDALIKGIELEPTNPTLHWRLGNVYLWEENYAEAEQEFVKTLELKADYVDAYRELSRMYESQLKLDEAIALYEPIMGFVNDNPVMLFDLGRLFYNRDQEGDLQRAELVWLRALEIDRNYSNVVYGLASLYEKVGRTADAILLYNRVLELNPANADVIEKIQSMGGN